MPPGPADRPYLAPSTLRCHPTCPPAAFSRPPRGLVTPWSLSRCLNSSQPQLPLALFSAPAAQAVTWDPGSFPLPPRAPPPSPDSKFCSAPGSVLGSLSLPLTPSRMLVNVTRPGCVAWASLLDYILACPTACPSGSSLCDDTQLLSSLPGSDP